MPNGKQVTEYYLQGSSNLNGKVYKTEELNGVVIERSWMLSPTMPASPPGTYSNVNPYLKTEFTSIRDAAGNLSKTAIFLKQLLKTNSVMILISSIHLPPSLSIKNFIQDNETSFQLFSGDKNDCHFISERIKSQTK